MTVLSRSVTVWRPNPSGIDRHGEYSVFIHCRYLKPDPSVNMIQLCDWFKMQIWRKMFDLWIFWSILFRYRSILTFVLSPRSRGQGRIFMHVGVGRLIGVVLVKPYLKVYMFEVIGFPIQIVTCNNNAQRVNYHNYQLLNLSTWQWLMQLTVHSLH